MTFSGFGGDPIRGWFFVPAGTTEPLPTIVEYIGYSGGRGLAHQVPSWPLAGYATFVVDTRGQGWFQGQSGATADPHGGGSVVPGFLTKGIEDPATYFAAAALSGKGGGPYHRRRQLGWVANLLG